MKLKPLHWLLFASVLFLGVALLNQLVGRPLSDFELQGFYCAVLALPLGIPPLARLINLKRLHEP